MRTPQPDRRTLMAGALDAARRGFAVFPVSPMRKTPAIKDWEQAATTDPDRIRSWYGGKRPFNIGIATGPSGLVVVDLDDGRGEPAPEPWAGARHGHDVLARLAAAVGAEIPENTYTVRTPTGGFHLYFKAPPGIPLHNTSGKLGWRIDTRARGGCVIAAGSLRPEGLYTVEHDAAAIADLPAWLTTALTPPPRPAAAPVLMSVGRLDPYIQAAVTYEAAAIAAAPVGSRNNQLFRSARSLGQLVGAGRLDEDDARNALLNAAASHIGIHGCTQHEVAQTITSGLTLGSQRPRRLLVDQQPTPPRTGRHRGAR